MLWSYTRLILFFILHTFANSCICARALGGRAYPSSLAPPTGPDSQPVTQEPSARSYGVSWSSASGVPVLPGWPQTPTYRLCICDNMCFAPHPPQTLDWTMNLWDLKRFRLNDPALAHVYKSQATLAKPVSKTGCEIHREMGAQRGRGKREVGEEGKTWSKAAAAPGRTWGLN